MERDQSNIKARSMTFRFKREDSQLLELNYENICDIQYLSKLFYHKVSDPYEYQYSDIEALDSNDDSQKQNAIFNNWLIEGSSCEELILFGDETEIGIRMILLRNQKALTSVITNQNENESALLNQQICLFVHLFSRIVSDCNIFTSLFVRRQILPLTIQNIEKNNRSFGNKIASMSLQSFQKIEVLSIDDCYRLMNIYYKAHSEDDICISIKNIFQTQYMKMLRTIGLQRNISLTDSNQYEQLKQLVQYSFCSLEISLHSSATFLLQSFLEILLISIFTQSLENQFYNNTNYIQTDSTAQLSSRSNANDISLDVSKSKLILKSKLFADVNHSSIVLNQNSNLKVFTNINTSNDNLSPRDTMTSSALSNKTTKLVLKSSFEKDKSKSILGSKLKSENRRLSKDSIDLFHIASELQCENFAIPGVSKDSTLANNKLTGKSLNDVIMNLEELQVVPIKLLKSISDYKHGYSSEVVQPIALPKMISSISTSVWTVGQNTYGELAHGDCLGRKHFQRVNDMNDKCIIDIGAGNEHSIFLSHLGQLYSCGYNDNGECGTSNNQTVHTPTTISMKSHKLSDKDSISQVHAYNGCEHTFIVSKDGKLFGMGYNHRGQLGTGSLESENQPSIIHSIISRKIIKVACSYHHSYFLCSDGSLWSVGRNDFGQLGLHDYIDRNTPQQVKTEVFEVSSISCGQYHSVLLTKLGIVYSCGKNDYGQTSLENIDNSNTFIQIPHKFHENEVITKVFCGYYHTLLLSSLNLVYGFGRSEHGQLGLGYHQSKVLACIEIVHLKDKNIIDIYCGCYHSIAVSINSMLYVFGKNNYSQLGTGDCEDKFTPYPIDDFLGKKIVKVAAGFYHTIVLVKDVRYEDLDDNPSYTFPTNSNDETLSVNNLKLLVPYLLKNLIDLEASKFTSYNFDNKQFLSHLRVIVIFFKICRSLWSENTKDALDMKMIMSEEVMLNVLLLSLNTFSRILHEKMNDIIVPRLFPIELSFKDFFTQPNSFDLSDRVLLFDEILSYLNCNRINEGDVIAQILSEICNCQREAFQMFLHFSQQVESIDSQIANEIHIEKKRLVNLTLSMLMEVNKMWSVCDNNLMMMLLSIVEHLSKGFSTLMSCDNDNNDNQHWKHILHYLSKILSSFGNLQHINELLTRESDTNSFLLLFKSLIVLYDVVNSNYSLLMDSNTIMDIRKVDNYLLTFSKIAIPILLSSDQTNTLAIDILKHLLNSFNQCIAKYVSETCIASNSSSCILSVKYILVESIFPIFCFYGISAIKQSCQESKRTILVNVEDEMKTLLSHVSQMTLNLLRLTCDSNDQFIESLDDPILSTSNIQNKRENHLLIRWIRLLKLVTMLSTKVSCSMQLSLELSHVYPQLTNHLLWKYFICNNNFEDIHNISDSTVINIKTCKYYDKLQILRRNKLDADRVYKMICQSKDSISIIQELEEILFCISSEFLIVDVYQEVWNKVVHYIKYLFTQRSILVETSSCSWIEILDLIRILVSHIANFIRKYCSPRITLSASLCCATLTTKSRWRRVILLISCVFRWKLAVKRSYKAIGSSVLTFFTCMIRDLTDSYQILQLSKLRRRWDMFKEECQYYFINARLHERSISLHCFHFQHVPLNILKSECLALALNSSLQISPLKMQFNKPMNHHNITKYVIETIEVFAKEMDTHHFISLYDANLLMLCFRWILKISMTEEFSYSILKESFIRTIIRILFYMEESTISSMESDKSIDCVKWIQSNLLTSFQSSHVSQLMSLCRDNKSAFHLKSSMNNTNSNSASKTIGIRERIKVFRRVSSSIISLVQSLMLRDDVHTSLIDVSFHLILYLQMNRLKHQRHMNQSNDSSLNQSQLLNKRRCQDIIAKPVEFSRSKDGIVVANEVLINTTKSVDFTIASWIYVTKHDSTTSFITGKLGLHDAWPIVCLRSDLKIEIKFGLHNELDTLVSKTSIALGQWTHFVIVSEGKQMKVFVNGVFDNQCKSNIAMRSLNHPLVIGNCAKIIKSRIDISHSFEGFLSSFKYYSRSLSPIHVKIVYDNGPPELFDFREHWILQMLSSLRVNLKKCRNFRNIKQHVEVLLSVMNTEIQSNRIRLASVNLLSLLLSSSSFECEDMLQDWRLTHRFGFSHASDTSGDLINLSCLMTTKTSYSRLHEFIIAYFIRLVGLCFSPQLLYVNQSSNRTAVSYDGGISYESKLPKNEDNVFLDALTDSSIQQLIKFSPCILLTSTNSSSDSIAMDNSFNALHSIKELGLAILNTIHNLADSNKDYKQHSWNEAIRQVLLSIGIIIKNSNLSLIDRIDFMGAMLLLGGYTNEVYTGGRVMSKYSNEFNVIIANDIVMNSVTVLSKASNRFEVMFLSFQDVLCEDVSRNYSFVSEDVIHIVISLLISLQPSVNLVMHDAFASLQSKPYDTESILFESLLLKYFRPMEIFMYHQCLRFLNKLIHLDQFKQSLIEIILSNSRIKMILEDACVHCLSLSAALWNEKSMLSSLFDDTTYANKNNGVVTLNTFQNSQLEPCCEVHIEKALEFSSKYLVSIPDLHLDLQFEGSTLQSCIRDYLSKSQGINLDHKNSIHSLDTFIAKAKLSTLSLDIPSDHITSSSVNTNTNTNTYTYTNTNTNTNTNSYCVSDWMQSLPQWNSKRHTTNSFMDIFDDLSSSEISTALSLIKDMRNNIIVFSRKLVSCFQYEVFASNQQNFILWECRCIDSTYWPDSKSITSSSSSSSLTSSEDQSTNLSHRVIDIMNCFDEQLRFVTTEFLEFKAYKSSMNILLSTDLFYRILISLFKWMKAFEGQQQELNILVYSIRTLLHNLSYVEEGDIYYSMLQLCRYSLRRLYQLRISMNISDSSLGSEGYIRLLQSHIFGMLRSRAVELLAKEKGRIHTSYSNNSLLSLNRNSRDLFDPIGYDDYKLKGALDVYPVPTFQLIQVVVGLEMIQRSSVFQFPHTTFRENDKNDLIIRRSIESFHNEKDESTLLNALGSPKLINIRSTSIHIDLSDMYTRVADLISERAFSLHSLTSEFSVISALSSYSEYIVIEIGLCVCYDDNLLNNIYEIIYCGNAISVTHSALHPGCSYAIRARALVGNYSFPWSCMEKFTTSLGELFTFDKLQCGPDIIISPDGLTITYQGDDNWSVVLGSHAFCQGITTWEMKIISTSSAYLFIGIATSKVDLTNFLGGDANGYGFIGEQALYHNREKLKIYGETFKVNDIIKVILDLNQGTLSYCINGKSLGIAFSNIYGEFYPAVAFYNSHQEVKLLNDSITCSHPHESIPISISNLRIHDISIILEVIFCIQTKSIFSYRLLSILCDDINKWCKDSDTHCIRRYKAITGKAIFINIKSKLLIETNLRHHDIVRTPWGLAEVIGEAYDHLWFQYPRTLGSSKEKEENAWYFSITRINELRQKGYFICASYRDGISKDTNHLESSHVPFSFIDESSLQDYINPMRWSSEMDGILIDYLFEKSKSLQVSPWNITYYDVIQDYRLIQQKLSKIVMDSMNLSYFWGIGGPKRRAVIARLGLLRFMNDLLESYLAVVLQDELALQRWQTLRSFDYETKVSEVLCGCVNQNSNESQKVKLSKSPSSNPIILSCVNDNNQHLTKHSISFEPLATSLLLLSTTWKPMKVSETLTLESLGCIRKLIFRDLKMNHFWDIITRSKLRPLKTDDDYEYPEDLAQVKINRFKSFRSREASDLLSISGEDLYLSSMFCQLWKELRQYPQETLKISYSHPMDDGQWRTFKVKFDTEGVDDYGGPYREVFQQICDELQFLDPSLSGLGDSLKVQVKTTTLLGHLKCFLPLLLPCPNWLYESGDIDEKYVFTFHPSSTSLMQLDMFRFFGQLVGIAIRSSITLNISLSSMIWKFVTKEVLSETDLKSFDMGAYDFISKLSCLYRKIISGVEDKESVEELQLELHEMIRDCTWTARRSDGIDINLKPNGSQLLLDFDHIEEFLQMYTEARFYESYQAMEAFRSGLYFIIPSYAITLLTGKELEDLVCGSKDIDINRLRDNSEYDDDVTATDKHILMLWEVLEEFSNEERSQFLRFVWARPTLPPLNVEFTQKFKIQSSFGSDEKSLQVDQYLPKAHTCFFSINLPKYSNKEIMKEKIKYAMYNCTEMDADFKLTDADIAGWEIDSLSRTTMSNMLLSPDNL